MADRSDPAGSGPADLRPTAGSKRRAFASEPALDDLQQAAIAAGVTLTTDRRAQLDAYLDTLLVWRVRLSLTATATRSGIICAHISDSLWPAPFVHDGFEVADLGSGAGFPGIPLAIACPRARFTLVESRRKRANFLREVVRRVRLANVEVAEKRAEALAESRSGAFDMTVSRAVWPLKTFLKVSRRFLRAGGYAIAMRSLGAGDAAHDVYPGFSLEDVVTYRTLARAAHVLQIFRKRDPDGVA